MSFLNNLIKGFARSAVNQVGRDGGRVISNQIYGDRHSIPVRRASSQSSVKSNIPTGYRARFFTSQWYIYPLIGVGTLFLSPIAWILYVYKIAYYLKKKTVTMVGYEETPVYKTDRRYRTGRKLVGYANIKKKIEVDSDNTKINRQKAIGWAVAFILICVPPLIYFAENF